MPQSASGISFSSLTDAQQTILVEMLEADEHGHALDVQQWLARYPQEVELIHQFLADRTALESLLTRQAHAAVLPAHVRYFGDYELLDVIARGGMGVIYRARQTSLNRIVALKMILGGQFSSATEVDRFRSEAQAAGQLDHPHIVPLYEVGEHQGQHYFTMKYVASGSLADLLANSETLPLKNDEAAGLIATVARAVHYAHQRGILHRDLKPANILLHREGDSLEPLVVDFGLAKKLDPEEHLTQTGAIVGTPCYMAPEQARAEKQLSTAIDVYSLGAILYELLTGQPPFKGKSVAHTLEQLQQREPSRPRALMPSLSIDLETICLKCLAKEPAQRYGSAEALAEDIDRWRTGSPIFARPVGVVERSIKWAQRHPTIAVLTALLLITVLSGLAGMALLFQRTQESAQVASRAAEAERHERERAQMAEQQAAEQRDRAEQSLYYHRVSAAYRYWKENNQIKMQELLASCQVKHRSWEWSYLQGLQSPEEKSMPGVSFQMTTDQKRMLVQQNDRKFVLWDIPEWKETRQLAVSAGWRCVLSPDGSRYATFSMQRKENGGTEILLEVRNTASDSLLFELKPVPIQADDVSTVCFSPDNSLLCLCGTQPNCAQGGYAGSTAFVIDGSTGATRYVLKSGGLHAAFSPDGKTLAAYHEQMEVFDSEGKPDPNAGLMESVHHWPTGTKLRFGQMLNRRDSWVELVEARTGKSLGQLKDPELPEVGQSFAWSPDTLRLCTLERGTTSVFDVASRKLVRKLTGHHDAATAIAFLPHQDYLITGGADTTIKQWNLKEGKSTQDWRGHQRWITSLAVIQQGKRILSASADGTIRCWNTSAQPGIRDWPEVADPAHGMGYQVHPFYWSTGYSRDGKQTLALETSTVGSLLQMAFAKDGASTASTLSLVDTLTQKSIRKFPSVWRSYSMSHQDMQLIFTRDGKFGAGYFQQQPVILDLEAGKEYFLPYGSGAGLSISPDDTQLVTVQSINFHSNNVPPVTGVMKYVESTPVVEGVVKQSPTLDVVDQPASIIPPEVRNPLPLLPSQISKIKLWDIKSRQEIASISLKDFQASDTAWSEDGRWVAVLGYGEYRQSGGMPNHHPEVRLIDMKTKQEKIKLKELGNQLPRKPCFSPDGKQIAAACWDGNVYVWNVETGELQHTLRGHQGYVWSACFSADGKRLFSSGNDASLKVWDPVTGEEILTIPQVAGKFTLRLDNENRLVGQGDYFFRRWLTK